MRVSSFRFWITASALWAAVTCLGNRVQAMQADANNQDREISLFITTDDDEVASESEQNAAPKFWLGIALKPVEGDLAKYIGSSDGVLVDSVYPDSPASKAGLEMGDILVAIGDEKLTDPKSLLAQMLKVKTDVGGAVPTFKLKILRKGDTRSLELTPVARPPERMNVTVNTAGIAQLTDDIKGALSFSIDLNDKSPEEIEKMVERLHGDNSNVRILRFGTPAKVHGDSKATTRMEIHKSVDGKNVDVTVNRDGDAPARIVVTKDGKSTEYSSDKMDDMPEDMRKMVTEMLEKKGSVTGEGRIAGVNNDAKLNKDGKPTTDRLAEIRERIALIAPNGNFDLKGVMDKDMAEKVSSMAKEIAARAEQSSKWAQAAAAMPAEVKELKSQVESLRAEIKELRDQLKTNLKQTSDK